MPIIVSPIPDPSLPLIPGEQLRAATTERSLPEIGALLGQADLSTSGLPITQDEDALQPMNSMIEINRLSMRRWKTGELQMRSGAGIATPTGAWVWLDYTPLLSPLLWASPRWIIDGVTRDNAGSPLGNCRVVILDVGQMAVGNAQAVIAETVSDGSGNYSVEVGQNKTYQAVCYLPGSPNRSGSSDYVTPSQA